MEMDFLLKEKIISWAFQYEFAKTVEDGIALDLQKIANFLPQILPVRESINTRKIFLYLCSVMSPSEYITMTEFDFTAALLDSMTFAGYNFLTSAIDFALVFDEGIEDTPAGIETLGTYIMIYEEGENLPEGTAGLGGIHYN
jgi:hypothetical protein